MADATMQRDLEVLSALNRDYISSVQQGDVRRFDEMLSDDFLCSSADGTLLDRAQFLMRTAQPVTIRDLMAEDVVIRVLGEAAIIHARTRYHTAEGELRQGRYTDVWVRRSTTWVAVAAHVTR